MKSSLGRRDRWNLKDYNRGRGIQSITLKQVSIEWQLLSENIPKSQYSEMPFGITFIYKFVTMHLFGIVHSLSQFRKCEYPSKDLSETESLYCKLCRTHPEHFCCPGTFVVQMLPIFHSCRTHFCTRTHAEHLNYVQQVFKSSLAKRVFYRTHRGTHSINESM